MAIGDGEGLGSLAMPFELHIRPLRTGPVRPGLIVGYVRYGMGEQRVAADRLPTDLLPGPRDVGFLGNAFRLGAVVEVPVARSLLLEARPVVDFIRFDQMTISDYGDVDLEDGGSTRRLGLSAGGAWVF